MAGKLRVPRRRGALTGLLLVVLGAWGGLIAFIGPYFHYAYTPDSAWTYTTGRLWLEILPGIGAVTGGAILLASTWRPVAIFGAWLAAISGAWFAIGSVLAPLWLHGSQALQGVPTGDAAARAVEQIGFFTGLGVVLVFLAAVALGRLTVLAARDVVDTADRKSDRASSPTPDDPDVAPSRQPDAPDVAPSRQPTAKALLRRVVPGKSAAKQSPADSEEKTEPVDVSS
jgi:hypothetical protein